MTATLPIVIAEADYLKGDDDGYGVCLACGDLNQGAHGWCEPDARNYKCGACGAPQLMGLAEALVRDLLTFGDVEPKL